MLSINIFPVKFLHEVCPSKNCTIRIRLNSDVVMLHVACSLSLIPPHKLYTKLLAIFDMIRLTIHILCITVGCHSHSKGTHSYTTLCNGFKEERKRRMYINYCLLKL